MKKLLINVVALLAISLSANAQIQMNSSGCVSVGSSTPSLPYRLKAEGSVLFDYGGYSGIKIENGGYYEKQIVPTQANTGYIGNANTPFRYVFAQTVTTSDKRQKENIKDINNALALILSIKGVKYDIKKEFAYNDTIKDEKYKAKREKERKNKIGFLAQDLEKIVPEAVVHEDSTDAYGVIYSSIIPILVEAMKEQQLIIDKLTADMKSLNAKSSQKNATLGINVGSTEQNLLFQNTPNPFTQSTQIEYQIVNNAQNALLTIYNMNGAQLKSIKINTKGAGNITLNGSEFGAGMYMYALIVDGRVIDTKQMVLTE